MTSKDLRDKFEKEFGTQYIMAGDEYIEWLEAKVIKLTPAKDIRSPKKTFVAFVDWFNKEFNRNFKPLDKLRPKFDALLKVYTKAELVKAIRTMYQDQWHRDKNFKYLTVEFCLRTDKVEFYLNKQDSYITPAKVNKEDNFDFSKYILVPSTAINDFGKKVVMEMCISGKFKKR